MGSLVPGCSGGNGLLGISAAILYQCSGISFSVSKIFRALIVGFYGKNKVSLPLYSRVGKVIIYRAHHKTEAGSTKQYPLQKTIQAIAEDIL
jgi:hypothetical protein